MIYSKSYIQPVKIDAVGSATVSVRTFITMCGTVTCANSVVIISKYVGDATGAPCIASGDCTGGNTISLGRFAFTIPKGNGVQ